MGQKKHIWCILGLVLTICLVSCPTTEPTQTKRIVPVFSLSALTGKNLFAKSLSVTDTNQDIAAIPFFATMFQGFTTAALDGDTYHTEVIDQPYTFIVTETASGIKFESTTIADNVYSLPTTLSVIVNEATHKFSVFENMIFDYNIANMGSGVIYRQISTPEYNGIGSFHENIELKYYDYGDPTWAKIDASWVEIFKNAQILAILVKSEMIDGENPTDPKDGIPSIIKSPRDWNSGEASAIQSEIQGIVVKNDLAKDLGCKYWTEDKPTEYSCILVVYNLATGSFDYKMSDSSGYFVGTVAGDLSTYSNNNGFFPGPTFSTLSTVLSSYGWTLLP